MHNFIKEIKIENYKCFNNFKADGFKRVNLIGGRNNVGKTTLLEACLLCMVDKYSSIYKRLLEIQTHRNLVNSVLQRQERREDLKNLILDNQNISITINGDKNLYIKNENEKYKLKTPFSEFQEMDYSLLFNRLDENINYSYMAFSSNYISPFSDFNESYNRGISSLYSLIFLGPLILPKNPKKSIRI